MCHVLGNYLQPMPSILQLSSTSKTCILDVPSAIMLQQVCHLCSLKCHVPQCEGILYV